MSTPERTRSRVAPRAAKLGDAALVSVEGLIDERFPGFGELSDSRTVVIDLIGVTFMSSFGVRQWIRSMAAVPSTVEHIYLVNCPTIIVDQLNMILNFGGRSKVVSLAAPFVCTKCGAEQRHTVDVIAEREQLSAGAPAARSCPKCGGTMEFDEMADSYFACLKRYGATELDPSAAALLSSAKQLKLADVKATVATGGSSTNTDAPGEAAPAPAITAVATTASRSRESTTKGAIIGAAVVIVLGLIGAGVYILVGPK